MWRKVNHNTTAESTERNNFFLLLSCACVSVCVCVGVCHAFLKAFWFTFPDFYQLTVSSAPAFPFRIRPSFSVSLSYKTGNRTQLFKKEKKKTITIIIRNNINNKNKRSVSDLKAAPRTHAATVT